MAAEARVRKLRTTSPEPQLDFAGVMRAVEEQGKKITEALSRVDLMHGAIQRTEQSVTHMREEFIKIIGEEKEDGNGGTIATGLLGRMHRNERAVKKMQETYRVWIAFGFGVVTTVGTCAALVWWLIGDKVGFVLKGTGHS